MSVNGNSEEKVKLHEQLREAMGEVGKLESPKDAAYELITVSQQVNATRQRLGDLRSQRDQLIVEMANRGVCRASISRMAGVGDPVIWRVLKKGSGRQ